jgi:hypothetical protein
MLRVIPQHECLRLPESDRISIGGIEELVSHARHIPLDPTVFLCSDVISLRPVSAPWLLSFSLMCSLCIFPAGV